MNLSPGDSNKSVIFTCGLGYVPGSEVLCVCVCMCVCVSVPPAWGHLAHHPRGSPASLQGERDLSGSQHPGREAGGGCVPAHRQEPWHLLPPCRELASLFLTTPSVQLNDIPRSFLLTVFLFVCFVFRAAPWHMEVPKLGVKLELQLLACSTATQDLSWSVTYTTAHGNAGSLTH